MKIGILTWLYNGNYGSILQAYALQKCLSNSGYEVKNINYKPTIKEKIKNLIKNKNSIGLFIDKWNTFLLKNASRDSYMVKEKKFNQFRQEEFNLTDCYTKPSDLKSIEGIYDAYICGSDQIWSPMLLNPVFYFDFLSSQNKLIAYACSFGVRCVPDSKKKMISNFLKRFSYISVREFQGQEIVKNLINEEVCQVVDPTLLLSSNQWDKITSEKLVEGNYVFCYFLSYEKKYWEKALKLAKELNLKIVMIPTVKEVYQFEGEVVGGIGPTDWISLIKYADFVITDSFHGCVFSLIYKKNFCVFKRFNDNTEKSQNSRIYTLLQSYELENCLVNDIDSYKIQQISAEKYLQVMEKISINVEDSLKWLNKALDENTKLKKKNNISQCVAAEECTGCGTCACICPQKCITMIQNERGFLIPKVNLDKCTECGFCSKKCPSISKLTLYGVKDVYAACDQKGELIKSSTSGGVFGVIAKKFLEEKDSMVYGAAYDELFYVKHEGIDNIKNLMKIQGSKYVQSEVYSVFLDIKNQLAEGKRVLFSGTGCQVAGLYSYLGKDYDNLITIELVCHGVPSPGLFRKYIEWLEKKRDTQLIEFRFRTKIKRPTGEHSQFYYVCGEREFFEYAYKDPYYASFLEGKTLRDSCYRCKYKGCNRVADITLGDFWGIEKKIKDFPIKNGVSMVLLNTLKGEKIFGSISENLILRKSTYRDAAEFNPSLEHSTRRPLEKVNFDSDELFSKELKPHFSLQKSIKNHIPWYVKLLIKRYL